VIPNTESACEFKVDQSSGLINNARRVDNTGLKFVVETDQPQECRMFNLFNEIVKSNDKIEITKQRDKWMDFTRRTQYLLDACMESSKSDGEIVKVDYKPFQ